MKKFKAILLVVIAVLASASPAAAQFRWGIKAGIDINKMNFSNTEFLTNASNRNGFTGGIMTEFNVPIINLCLDASLMYTHKTNKADIKPDKSDPELIKYGSDYLSIPINLKYKFGLPIVGNVIAPYIFTGPEFSFLLSKKAVGDFVHNHKSDIAWNLGFGLQLLNHLQISAGYGWGIKKAVTITNGETTKTARNNAWTVTAAYLF